VKLYGACTFVRRVARRSKYIRMIRPSFWLRRNLRALSFFEKRACVNESAWLFCGGLLSSSSSRLSCYLHGSVASAIAVIVGTHTSSRAALAVLAAHYVSMCANGNRH
jgi:hypothetical protein